MSSVPKLIHRLKMPTVTKLIYRFDAIPIKILRVFHENWKLILKFIWKCKGPRITNNILKKNKVRRPFPPDIKTYLKAMVIEKVWYCSEDKQIDHWNGMDWYSRTVQKHTRTHTKNSRFFSKLNYRAGGKYGHFRKKKKFPEQLGGDMVKKKKVTVPLSHTMLILKPCFLRKILISSVILLWENSWEIFFPKASPHPAPYMVIWNNKKFIK